MTGEFLKLKVTDIGVTRFSPHGQFLSVGRIKLRNLPISASSWQSLTSDLLPSNLRRVVGHITRERDIFDFNSGFDLYKKNTGTCRDTLMNGHWEELIGKVEELLHAANHPDNYRMHIQYIQFSSDGLQRLKSFLNLHVRKRVQGVICHHQVRVAVPLSTSNNNNWQTGNWQTGHAGHMRMQIQLLTKHLRKSWGIILICAMRSKSK